MQYTLQRLTYILMSCALLLMCTVVNSSNAGGAHSPSKEMAGKETNITIKSILDDPGSFEDKDITVQGLYKGWSGTCASSAMLTRSDWILEDETGCIYVTGRIPDNVSPLKPLGERLQVTGRIQANNKGKAIIKADQIRQLPNR